MTIVSLARVLVVDDEPAVLITLSALLADEFEVKTADGVGAALDALDRSDFHVVVADHGLPDGTGLDVLRYARELDVIVGGFIFTGRPDFAAGQTRGQFQVLPKSANPAAILDAVRSTVAEVVAVRGSVIVSPPVRQPRGGG